MTLETPLSASLSISLSGLYVAGSSGGRSGYMTWANFNAELITAANANGHNDSDPEFGAFTDYIFFDAAAFNLASGAALDTALTNETMSLADLDTYAQAYTP